MPKSCWNCGTLLARPDLSLAPPSVDLTRLLTSNDVPHSSEIPNVLKALSDHEARLALLDAQIESMQSTLAELARERNEIAESLRQHHVILSPVRRVPPELLGEIFSLTLPWSRHIHNVVAHQPPWRLGHVCALWRHAAVTYPALWRYFDLSPSFTTPVNQYPLPMLETTLLRSGNLPLDVTFGGWSQQTSNAAWLDMFLSHCNRWATIHILYVTDSGAFRDIFRRVKGQLPALQKLKLLSPRYHDVPDLPDYFATAPELREVLLTNSGLDRPSHALPIPWSQITHYRGVYSPSHQLQILQSAPNLVHCGMGFIDNDNALEENQIVTLPCLRRLHSRESSFLDHLQLPSLDTLFLLYDGDTLPSLVQRSSCQLTKLVLMEHQITTAFPAVLQSIPSLAYLVLEVEQQRRKETNHLFKAMTVSGSPSDLCPNLVSFAFGRGDGCSPTETELFSMVRSRLKPNIPCRLSCLRIIYMRYYDYGNTTDDDLAPATLLARIKKLADAGLDAAFVWSNGEIAALTQMSWSDSS
ncbi:hypothetical protein FB451DRAFT_272076 [Mycena latifolia]|nr:hypothetical protein FB451DRAFT_272076 [Mycena latifolia]